jgi:hypothetical protein
MRRTVIALFLMRFVGTAVAVDRYEASGMVGSIIVK